MKVSLTNLDGSGAVAGKSLFGYSYSEDVTSLQPSSIEGGTGQVSASAIAIDEDKIDFTHPNSKLLINNQMSLTHQDGGEIQFIVKQVSTNNGIVSIVGSTVADRLNTEVFAIAHGGSGYTLLSAIDYYCGLVGISIENNNLIFDGELAADLDLIPVNFISWKGNLWEHIKMLCAAMSASLTDNVGFEAYTVNDTLVFRYARENDAVYTDHDLSQQSISINSFDAAKEIQIYNYNTSYKVDSVVHDINVNKSGLSYVNQNVSIAEPLQVDAGQTLIRRFTIDASLEELNQPDAVDAILPLPYTTGIGQYAIAGSDGILLSAAQWKAEGGKLTVALTENPNEIEITLTAPPVPTIQYAGTTLPDDVGYAPYRIGVEVADGAEYPALYITGTGVFYDKVIHKFPTGASDTYTTAISAPVIDNPFLTNLNDMYSRGTAAAQAICGPSVSLSENVGKILLFGETAGTMRTVDSNKFRITSVNYTQDATGMMAIPYASFTDFNTLWTGLTFADFTNTALDPAVYPVEALKFNEFTIIPLMQPEVVV